MLQRMRRRALFAIPALVVLAGGGAAAWWASRPAPPPPPPAEERGYKDIERPEYEKWMQDLGYTE